MRVRFFRGIICAFAVMSLLTACSNDDSAPATVKVYTPETAPEPEHILKAETPLYLTYDNSCGDLSELNEYFRIRRSETKLPDEQTYEVQTKSPLTPAQLAQIADDNECVILISELPQPIKLEPKPELESKPEPQNKPDPQPDTEPSFTTFNDPAYKNQTSLHFINAEQAYRILFNGPQGLKSFAKIGIIDRNKVNGQNPDLIDQLLPGSDTTSNSSETDHGQYVLGIMAAKANNGWGSVGVAGLQAKFLYKSLPIRRRTSDGGIVDMVTVANTLRTMGANGIDVVNLSLGVSRKCLRRIGQCTHPIAADPTVLRAMKDTAAKYGTLFVIAAGNSHDEVPVYSSPRDGILVIGAIDHMRQKSAYSNYGPGVNFYAPDFGVYGLSFNGYENRAKVENGTSFTTPLVAGAAALIKSYLRQNGTNISAADLATLILRNGTNMRTDITVLNFGKAAEDAQKLVNQSR